MKLNKLLTRMGALLLCGVLLVTLVACGGKEPEDPPRSRRRAFLRRRGDDGQT